MNNQPDHSVTAVKAAMRLEICQAIARLESSRRKDLSRQACSLMKSQALWVDSKEVLLFAPLPSEIDAWDLVQEALSAGKRVALPRFSPSERRYVACHIESPEQDLTLGRYGIREPNADRSLIPLNRLDLVLVPGIAFDLHGHRLGRGKGYYDQLLACVRGRTCGIAFDQQVVANLPVEPHDVFVNCIVTPTRFLVV